MSALLEALRQIAQDKTRNESSEQSGGRTLNVRIPPVEPADLTDTSQPREEAPTESQQPAPSLEGEASPSSNDLTDTEAETLSLLLAGEVRETGEPANPAEADLKETGHPAVEYAAHHGATSDADELEALLLAQSDSGPSASTHEAGWNEEREADAPSEQQYETQWAVTGSDASSAVGEPEPASGGGLSEEEQAALLAQREAAFSDYAAQMDASEQAASAQGFEEWEIPDTVPVASTHAGVDQTESDPLLASEKGEKQSEEPLISQEETARALLSADAVTAPADSKEEAVGNGGERVVSLLIWFALPLLFAGALGYGGWQWYQHLEEDFEQQYRRMDYQRLEQQYRHTVQPSQAADQAEKGNSDADEKPGQPDVASKAEVSRSSSGEAALVATDLSDKDTPLSVLIQPEVRIIRQVIPAAETSRPKVSPAVSSLPPEPVESHVEPAAEVAIHMDPLSEVETLLQQGHAEQAIRRLSTFLSRHPQEAQGYVLMGLAYQQLRQPARTLYYLQKALQLDPYAQAAAEAMALTVVSLPDTHTETVLASLFERFPQSEVIALYYANHLAQSHRLKDAVEILQQSIRLAPAANLYYNLAVLQVAAGAYEAAREAVRQALIYMNRTPHSFQEADLLRLMQQIQPYLIQEEKAP